MVTQASTTTQLVESLFEAFGRGDIGFILEHVSADCLWITPGDGIPSSGVYRGHEGAAHFFQKLSQTEKITRFEPREYFTNGDAVVVLGSEDAESIATGKKASTEWAMLFRVRDGQVVHYQSFFDTAAYTVAHTRS